MAKSTKLQQVQSNIKIIERNGWCFYVLPYRPNDVWVAGVDISRKLGVSNAEKHAYKLFNSNKTIKASDGKTLEDHSRLIEAQRSVELTPLSRGGQIGERKTQLIRVFDEVGFHFFISLCRSKKAREHTLSVLSDYVNLKTKINPTKSVDWDTAREFGKKQRRCLTDAIQRFEQYATINGSSNGKRYYKIITQKINSILFEVHGRGTPEGFRDKLSQIELSILGIVEERVADHLYYCMDQNVEYHEIVLGLNRIAENGKQVLGFRTVPRMLI